MPFWRCSLDRHLLDNLDYLNDLMAGKEAHVFKSPSLPPSLLSPSSASQPLRRYADRNRLFFDCQIAISIKEPGLPCPVPPHLSRLSPPAPLRSAPLQRPVACPPAGSRRGKRSALPPAPAPPESPLPLSLPLMGSDAVPCQERGGRAVPGGGGGGCLRGPQRAPHRRLHRLPQRRRAPGSRRPPPPPHRCPVHSPSPHLIGAPTPAHHL